MQSNNELRDLHSVRPVTSIYSVNTGCLPFLSSVPIIQCIENTQQLSSRWPIHRVTLQACMYHLGQNSKLWNVLELSNFSLPVVRPFSERRQHDVKFRPFEAIECPFVGYQLESNHANCPDVHSGICNDGGCTAMKCLKRFGWGVYGAECQPCWKTCTIPGELVSCWSESVACDYIFGLCSSTFRHQEGCNRIA